MNAHKFPLLFNLESTQPDVLSKRHGGGKYGEMVFRRIVKRELPVICYYDSTRWLNPDVKSIIDGNGIKLYNLQGETVQGLVDKIGAKILFSPQYTRELARLQRIEVIGTIHGLRGLETPWDSDMVNYKPWKNAVKYYVYKIFKNKRVRKEYDLLRTVFDNPCCHIVTVSNHSASSIKCYLPNYQKKDIPVFYSPSTSAELSLSRKCYDKYFLIVSANRSYKNALRAIRAFDRLFENEFLEGYKVKITGASSWGTYRYKPMHPDRFEFLGFVEELELEQLYHDAYCLVYPSLNEGFGYPPLEAMHYGTPVITSSFSSIPEVCGDAVLYFNPLSVEEIMSRILLVCREEIHQLLSERAKMRYKYITEKQFEDLDRLIDYTYDIAAKVGGAEM